MNSTEYGYSLKRLASRAFPTFPSEMRESLTVEQFITGLNGHELKRFVQFAHPKTLDRAISLALEFESFDGSPNSPRKPKDTEKPPVGFARAILPPVEKNDCNSQITLEKLEETIQQIMQKSLKSMNVQKHERSIGAPQLILLMTKDIYICLPPLYYTIVKACNSPPF